MDSEYTLGLPYKLHYLHFFLFVLNIFTTLSSALALRKRSSLHLGTYYKCPVKNMHDAYTYTENSETDCNSRHRHDISKRVCQTRSAFPQIINNYFKCTIAQNAVTRSSSFNNTILHLIFSVMPVSASLHSSVSLNTLSTNTTLCFDYLQQLKILSDENISMTFTFLRLLQES